MRGQLWDDIIKTDSNEKVSGHFVGSVVYQVSSIPQLLVISEAGKGASQ
jgi:hypothetical protein